MKQRSAMFDIRLALLAMTIGLFPGKAAGESNSLDRIFQKEVLDEEDFEELETLNRDEPKSLGLKLNEVWLKQKDTTNKKIFANLSWAILVNLYEQSITAGQDDILQRLLSPEYATAIEPMRNDLEFRKWGNALAEGKAQFSEIKDNYLNAALHTENPKRRRTNISAAIFDFLDHGLHPNELATHISELRQHLTLDANLITAQDLNFINYMSLILEKIDLLKESRKLQTVLENYCTIRQARSFCSLFFYNKGYFELKHMEPGYAQRGLAAMQTALLLAQAVKDKDNIASAHYGLEWAYRSLGDYSNAIKNGLLAAEEYKELQKPDWIATVLLHLSMAYFQIHDFKNALRSAEEALSTCPPEFKVEITSIYWHLANVHEAMGTHQESNRYLRLFLKLRTQTQTEDVNKKYLEMRNESLDKQNELQREQIRLLSRFRLVSGLAGLLFLLACAATVYILVQSRVIEKQKTALQEVMNNIKIGIIKLDKSLKMQAETSAWAFQFFGLGDDEDIHTILSKLDASEDEKQSTIEALKIAVGSDELQWEMNAGTLLSKAYFGNRRIHISYSPVFKSGALNEVICNIEDVTERYETEKAIKSADEKAGRIIAKARKIIAKGPAAKSFLSDIDRLLVGFETYAQSSVDASEALKQQLHSIKGSARTLGFSDIASIAHDIESAISKNDQELARAQVVVLIAEIQEYQNARELYFESDSIAVESILEIVARLRPDIEARLKEHGIPLESITVADGVGMASPFVKEILLHGLGNAIDHGFILPKYILPAKLEIEATRIEGKHRLVIRDNGVGMDWNKLEDIARKRHFTPSAGRPVSDVVFLEGVSTAATVSLTSGRGQGMGIIKSAADRLHGDAQLLDNDKTRGSMLVVVWNS